MKISKTVLFNIFYVSLFFQSLRIIPLNIETQPVLPFLFGVIWFFLFFDFKFSKGSIYAVVLIIILTIYSVVGYFTYGANVFFEFIKYFIPPFLFIVFRKQWSRLSIISLYFISLLYGLYFFSSIIFGVDFINSFSFFGVRSVHRFTYFNVEPSYFAYPLALFLLGLEVIGATKSDQSGSIQSLRLFILFISIFTFSIYVYMVLIFYFIAKVNIKKDFLILLVFAAFIPFIYFVIPIENTGRVVSFIHGVYLLLSDQVSIFDFIYQIEPSGSTRLILNFMAFSVPLTMSVFGIGFLGFSQNWLLIAGNLGVNVSRHEVLSAISSPVPQTYFTNFVSAVGIFSIVYFFIFLSGLNKIRIKKDIRHKSIKRFVILFFIFATFFQSQVSNPIFWIAMLALKDNEV